MPSGAQSLKEVYMSDRQILAGIEQENDSLSVESLASVTSSSVTVEQLTYCMK